MAKPDMTDLESKCGVLERIANNFPDGTPERDAIDTAAYAMHYVSHLETQAKFRIWVESWTQPPTALQILNAKLAGIEDLPHELMDDTMREIEHLMERLRLTRR
jgi:hypothetical protein